MRVESALKMGIRMMWQCVPKRHRASLLNAIIRQASADEQRSVAMGNLSLILTLLRTIGFRPDLIVDVGANRGSWTLEAYRIFPEPRYFLVDADPANAKGLEEVCSALPQCSFSISLLGRESRSNVRFYQMGTGSSVLAEKTEIDRNELLLSMTTLDDLVKASGFERGLLKLDVQGYELEVLLGARELLSKAEVVILECSLIQYNDDAPLFAEVVDFMKSRGFLTYDFCGQARRASDGVLFQTDVVFVKEESNLRKPFTDWTPK